MKTKIIIILLVVVLVAGGYLLYSIFGKVGDGYDVLGLFDFETFGFSDVDLYLSDLSAAQLPEISLSDNLGFNLPDINMGSISEIGQTPVPSINFDASVFDVSSPQMGIPQIPSGPGQGEDTTSSPGGWIPNVSDCAQFSMAPSCSFVPAQYQEMCKQCKAAGY